MARRVTWTNNSTDYDGTNVYRDTTIDPQNLPAPAATVGPVAQGATAEWNDTETLDPGGYDYAVRDYGGGEEGALSAVETYTVEPSLGTAQVGDEIEGGIYAGTITYADSRQFHLIFAKAAEELLPAEGDTRWSINNISGGPTSDDDGYQNTQDLLTLSATNHPAALYCDSLSASGFNDWYLPAPNELAKGEDLALMSHPDFTGYSTQYRWASKDAGAGRAILIRWSPYSLIADSQNQTDKHVRPVRRVPV